MSAASKASLDEIWAAFHSDQTGKVAAARLGLSLNTLRRRWKEHFGDDAYRARSRRFRKGAPDGATGDALKAFRTDEPFKKVARRLGMSPNTLRDLWVQRFGTEAFQQRGKDIQRKGATAFGARTKGVPKTKSFVTISCGGCGVTIRVTKLQKARMTQALCGSCRGLDRKCPVCGQACHGPRGLVSHFAWAKDERHRQYQAEKEHAKWDGLVDGRDFVTCQECGLRGQSLTNHIKLHGLTAEQYRDKHPRASVVASVSETKRIQSLDAFASERAYGWSREDLLRFQDEQGRVIVAEAALAFGASPATVLLYCRSLGLPTRNRLAWQRVVLDQAAKALNASYEWEWSDDRLRNPETGRPFNYDGYFPDINLIVEAHGDQHFRYSESWHSSLERFHELRERDATKKRMAEELGYRVVVVRLPDPTHDPVFWERALKGQPGVSPDEVSRVLAELRQHDFPAPIPSGVEAKKALTRLLKVQAHVDPQGIVRPYSTTGTTACASFFPSRYHARHKAAKHSAYEAWYDDDKLRKAIDLQLSSGHPTTPPRVLRALVMFCRTPSVFRPVIAKYVYQAFAAKGVVWDPCAGYGGRLLGALAAGVSKYIGTDIEESIVQGNRQLADSLGVSDWCRVVQHRAETFDPGEPLDLVFTSPPYFNLETYGDTPEYGTPQGWAQDFLRPVMRRAADRLKSGGYLVLNLPSKPQRGVRLDLEAVVVGRSLPLLERPMCWMPVRTFKGRVRGEPILVWQAE